MPLAAIAVVVGAALGAATGRRPPRRGGRPDRMDVALLAAGALLSAVGTWVAAGDPGVAVAAAGYALLAGFAGRHREHPGMVLIAAGLVANLVVMAADGGMPVRGLAPGVSNGLHHSLTSADHLPALSDVIAVPALGLTVSPGDLVLSLGGAMAAFGWLVDPRRRPVGRASR